VKIIVTSDWHLDWATGGLPRFADVFAAVQVIVDAAKREGVEMVMFLGDLTDPDAVRAHQAVSVAMWVATHLWFCAGIATRWLVGNHDVVEDGSGSSSLSAVHAFGVALPRGAKQGVKVYTEPEVEVFGNKAILALPFTPRSHPYDPLTFVRSLDPNPGGVIRPIDLVVGHLNIEGIGPGSETTDMPRGRDVFLPVAAIRERWPDAVVCNGHYHRRQVFDGVHVPGSLARLTFGEEHNSPGYLVVEV
jgi:DNA repair exonuclease SbcCD nuclease subunit